MPSKTILDCDKDLQKVWSEIVHYLRKSHPHYHVQILETHVPPEEQKDRWNIGRNGLGELLGDGNKTVTNFDGTEKMTLFNYYPSRALRFRVLGDGGEVYPPDVYRVVTNLTSHKRMGFEPPDVIYKV